MLTGAPVVASTVEGSATATPHSSVSGGGSLFDGIWVVAARITKPLRSVTWFRPNSERYPRSMAIFLQGYSRTPYTAPMGSRGPDVVFCVALPKKIVPEYSLMIWKRLSGKT